MKIIKEAIIIIIAAVIGFAVVKKYDFGAFLNILMFMAIYIIVALAVEYSIRLYKKLNRSKKKTQ